RFLRNRCLQTCGFRKNPPTAFTNVILRLPGLPSIFLPTYSEMSRKRREYFRAGVELLWMIDPRERTVAVYRSANDVTVLHDDDSRHADPVLPDWTVNLAALFAKLDESAPPGVSGIVSGTIQPAHRKTVVNRRTEI
ncbi:MAG: Uma2 family endonuclease, partial [Planctomycetaceae bacterium]|nr:Uma2 family endonuclease [Planctomycetaceae bacterium]